MATSKEVNLVHGRNIVRYYNCIVKMADRTQLKIVIGLPYYMYCQAICKLGNFQMFGNVYVR